MVHKLFRITLRLLPILSLILFPALLSAASADGAIREALQAQLAAWNRGDIPAFVSTYAGDCTFVSDQILQGREQLLERYKKAYPSTDAMGKLTFKNLSIRLLDEQAAVATGEWHLDRNKAAGGPVGGVFSLVWRRENGHWLIVLDHTS